MAWANWETLVVDTNGGILHDDFTEGKFALSGSAALSIYDDIRGLHLISRIGDFDLSEEEFWKQIQTEINSFDNPNTFPHL